MEKVTIIENKIQCNNCKDIIESRYTHEMKWCSCGSVAVDGGKQYLKRCARNDNGFKDLSKCIVEQMNI